MHKKAVSPVILIVLTIIFGVAAVAILWSDISPLLQKLGSVKSSSECLLTSVVPSSCVFNKTIVAVRVTRQGDSGNISKLNFIIATQRGTAHVKRPASMLDNLESMTYTFAPALLPGEPNTVDVSILLANGKMCQPTNKPLKCVAGNPTEQTALVNARACSDGLDNDGDGWIDIDGAGNDNERDPGCQNSTDNNETNDQRSTQCSDELDNDDPEDTFIDGYDPQCANWQGTNESMQGTSLPACSNGDDDDTDWLKDYPVDPGCQNSTDNSEVNDPNIRNETLFVYTWNLQNNSLSNLIAFPMFGTESLLTEGPYGRGYRTLDTGYMTRAIQEQKARGGKAVIMDWNLWGGGNNVLNKKVKAPFFNHSLDRCQYPNGSLTQFPCMWQDYGINETAARYTSYFNDLKRELDRNIQTVDFLILDMEPLFGWWEIKNWPCAGLDNNSITECPEGGNIPEIGEQFFQVLQNEPRNESLFEETGVRNMMNLYNYVMPDIWIFTARMIERNADQINRAIYDPVKIIYQDIDVSNYAYDQNQLISRRWGHKDREYLEGRQAHVGTHQAPSLYAGSSINICLDQTDDRIYQCNWVNAETPPPNGYHNTPFNAFKYDINELRSAKINSNFPLSPWISHKTFGGSLIRKSDLYQEQLMHIALTNPEYIIGWNPHPWRQDQSTEGMASNETDYLMDATMKEIEKVVWFSDRETPRVTPSASWKADYVLTGMSSAGRKVWRFTPNLDTTSGAGINFTIVSENPGVVVQTANYTITFAEGVIHRPVNPVSTQGLWIVQPKNAPEPSIQRN